MARLNMARSRARPAICSLVRIDQTCFGRRGGFETINFPLFQGSRGEACGMASMESRIMGSSVAEGYQAIRMCLSVVEGLRRISAYRQIWLRPSIRIDRVLAGDDRLRVANLSAERSRSSSHRFAEVRPKRVDCGRSGDDSQEQMMAYDYSQYGGVLVERRDKVLTITLNSPETLNAFTGPMHTSMSHIWDDVNDDPDVHVVVLTGAGPAFSAGWNLIPLQRKIHDPAARDARI